MTELPTTGERAERCETCRWWVPIDPKTAYRGDCRTHSPIAVPCDDYAGGSNTVWPSTLPKDFCGEWAAKPKGR